MSHLYCTRRISQVGEWMWLWWKAANMRACPGRDSAGDRAGLGHKAPGFVSLTFVLRSAFIIIFISLWEGKCVWYISGFNPAIVLEGLSCLGSTGGSNINFTVERFRPKSEKRLLASSCPPARPSVCPSAWNNSAPIGRILMKFDIWDLLENLPRKFKFN